ncbi:tetratricopeptide repeat protein [uncultured Alistipes sp.]|uniref:tetratricopeptide repeat protein n=1 Tax=Alistipes sp. TaxID=1872444 RepID=UPI002627FA0F|nr:tetratricopeptide repeat protein [uncultured Alistipes sp.]
MYRLLYMVFLFAALGASAQNMPERSEVRRGNRQYNKGNYEKSIERYERALGAAPESFEAIYNLGNALYKAERFDKAEQTMRKAAADSLRADGERAEAFYNLGNAQFKQQKYKEALESYKQSLRLNPDDQEAKYNYAYTKRLLDENKDGGGGGNDDQNQDKDQNQDQQQQGGGEDKQDKQDGDRQQDDQAQQGDDQEQQGEQQNPPQPDKGDEGDEQGEQQPVPAGISPQEQEQMLDAIQAQEDRTQDKLKEKQGVVVRGKKNW